jgi:hypothetical protein
VEKVDFGADNQGLTKSKFLPKLIPHKALLILSYGQLLFYFFLLLWIINLLIYLLCLKLILVKQSPWLNSLALSLQQICKYAKAKEQVGYM